MNYFSSWHPRYIMLILICSSQLQAQKMLLSPTIISNASGEGKSLNTWITWTLGETLIQSTTLDDRWYTEGFHQPTIIVKTTFTSLRENVISVFPNPTMSAVQLNMSPALSTDAILSLIDIKGSVLYSSTLKSGLNQSSMDLQLIQAGIYFLQVRNLAGDLFNTCKIIKL